MTTRPSARQVTAPQDDEIELVSYHETSSKSSSSSFSTSASVVTRDRQREGDHSAAGVIPAYSPTTDSRSAMDSQVDVKAALQQGSSQGDRGALASSKAAPPDKGAIIVEDEQKAILWRPACTPKLFMIIFASYAVVLLSLGAAYLDGTSTVKEVILELKSQTMSCTAATGNDDTGISGSVTRACTMIGTGTAGMVETLSFTPEEDLEGPVYLYYGMDGFYQTHRNLIRGFENAMSAKQVRAGSCMPYQEGRTGCKPESMKDFFPAHGESWETAVYQLWYPKQMMNARTGCYLWWSTRSQECLENGDNDSEVCKAGPLGTFPPTAADNKVHYPCGLGARLVGDGGLDSMVLTDSSNTALPQVTRPEEVSFDADWEFSKRNLDPEATFEKDRNLFEDEDSAQLEGKKYYEILNMHLLKVFPPQVCVDDPLRLQPVQTLADGSTADCTNYRGFSFDSSANAATCNYNMTASVTNPLSGSAITCGAKAANPSGWGIENSQWLNFQRLSSYHDIRKLFAKIPEGTKLSKGSTYKLFYAHRLDLTKHAGVGHDIKKKVFIQSGSWAGGSDSLVVAAITVAGGGLCLLIAALVFFAHAKDPQRLDRIIYMEWPDFRSASAVAA
ncbi:unnamed protein product [Amoebophrya sp. A25]|nr:unnamed protein product [Amoebophrya sp. A25]|eukprot:GSA25T00007158001.1